MKKKIIVGVVRQTRENFLDMLENAEQAFELIEEKLEYEEQTYQKAQLALNALVETMKTVKPDIINKYMIKEIEEKKEKLYEKEIYTVKYEWILMLDVDVKDQIRAMLTQAINHYGKISDDVVLDVSTKFKISQTQVRELIEWNFKGYMIEEIEEKKEKLYEKETYTYMIEEIEEKKEKLYEKETYTAQMEEVAELFKGNILDLEIETIVQEIINDCIESKIPPEIAFEIIEANISDLEIEMIVEEIIKDCIESNIPAEIELKIIEDIIKKNTPEHGKKETIEEIFTMSKNLANFEKLLYKNVDNHPDVITQIGREIKEEDILRVASRPRITRVIPKLFKQEKEMIIDGSVKNTYPNKVGDKVVLVNLSGHLQLCRILELSDDHMNIRYNPHEMQILDQWINIHDSRFLRSLPIGFKIGEIYTDAHICNTPLIHNPGQQINVDSNWIVELAISEAERGWKLIAISGIAIHKYNEEKMRKKYKRPSLSAHLTFHRRPHKKTINPLVFVHQIAEEFLKENISELTKKKAFNKILQGIKISISNFKASILHNTKQQIFEVFETLFQTNVETAGVTIQIVEKIMKENITNKKERMVEASIENSTMALENTLLKLHKKLWKKYFANIPEPEKKKIVKEVIENVIEKNTPKIEEIFEEIANRFRIKICSKTIIQNGIVPKIQIVGKINSLEILQKIADEVLEENIPKPEKKEKILKEILQSVKHNMSIFKKENPFLNTMLIV